MSFLEEKFVRFKWKMPRGQWFCRKSTCSDASAVGYGGYIEKLADSELIGSWSQSEMVQSSTWLELEAVRRLVEHSKDSLEGQSLLIKTDNKRIIKT